MLADEIAVDVVVGAPRLYRWRRQKALDRSAAIADAFPGLSPEPF
jgi:hypothetical protein